LSEKQLTGFTALVFGKPSQRARGFGKDVVRDKNIVVGVLAVPAAAAQKVADYLVDAGVRSSSTTRKACSTCEPMSPSHVETPPWNCARLYFHLA